MIICITLATLGNSGAQIKFDFKVGASPGSNPKSAATLINRSNPSEEFQFNMVKAEPQLFAGIAAHVPLKAPFFLEGGISYTKSASVYRIDYSYPEPGPKEQFMKGSEAMVMLPVNIGARIGNFEVTSGFTAIQSLSVESELAHLNGFKNEAKAVKLGWQMGARYDLKVVMLGAEYQGAFSRVCQGMNVNNESLEIMNVPGRWVFNIQYRF